MQGDAAGLVVGRRQRVVRPQLRGERAGVGVELGVAEGPVAGSQRRRRAASAGTWRSKPSATVAKLSVALGPAAGLGQAGAVAGHQLGQGGRPALDQPVQALARTARPAPRASASSKWSSAYSHRQSRPPPCSTTVRVSAHLACGRRPATRDGCEQPGSARLAKSVFSSTNRKSNSGPSSRNRWSLSTSASATSCRSSTALLARAVPAQLRAQLLGRVPAAAGCSTVLANIPTLASNSCTGRLATGLAMQRPVPAGHAVQAPGEHAEQQLEPGQPQLGAEPVQLGAPGLTSSVDVQQPRRRGRPRPAGRWAGSGC